MSKREAVNSLKQQLIKECASLGVLSNESLSEIWSKIVSCAGGVKKAYLTEAEDIVADYISETRGAKQQMLTGLLTLTNKYLKEDE